MFKIVLSGGGTLGSVTPLLAMAAKIKENEPSAEFFWIGTRYGPEDEVVDKAGIKFHKIFSGKLRRYFDWRNFIDPIRLLFGFIQSFFILRKLRPNVIVGAGGFVQVPVVIAGWILRIPVFLHQQDIKPSLSNLLIAKLAKKITVNFDESAKYFSNTRVEIVGNPARLNMLTGDREVAKKMFHLEEALPVVLVLGGGTGALRLNHLIWKALPALQDKVQIIHSVGKKKLETNRADALRYHHYEFLGEELAHAYAVADLVVCRAGMATLTELAARGMSAILVPILRTHQVDNARYFESKGAALYFDEGRSPEELAKLIVETLRNNDLRQKLAQNIRLLYHDESADVLANAILSISSVFPHQ